MQKLPPVATSTSYTSMQALRKQSFSTQAPPLQRTMTAPLIESSNGPIGSSAPSAASGSIFNDKPAALSLYQDCRLIVEKLKQVEGFDALYLQDTTEPQNSNTMTKDPVADLWRCFRLGASLCHLYNATHPEIELSTRTEPSMANLNSCKAEVYHFLLACKKHLNFADDELFTISELYSENTNGFVKVTKTVSRVLNVLQEQNLLIKKDDPSDTEADFSVPKDNRAKVIAELLDTERKYVQYLEILQNYMRELQIGEIVSADTLHHLFSNLNDLVDFQRRFLIAIERTCAQKADEQNIGVVFANLEDAFNVYEPFCANYTYAADLAIEETPKLRKLEHLIEPSYELPSLLIKPIQRVCKYPLLLRELIKFTTKDHPFYLELESGEAAIRRVTDRVNETRRRQENALVVVDLEKRVEDWKGHSVASFGNLLLEDTFQVTKGDVEREYRVFLFERILLCCKENKEMKKNSKSMSISKKPKKRSSLQLKGRIFINNVTDVVVASRNSSYTLQVFWKGDQDQEYFTLKCRNEENQKQWHAALTRLIEEAQIALAEYRSNQNSSAYVPRGLSNTQLTSLQQMSLVDHDGRGEYESDEESQRTEDTTDDAGSINGSIPMSRATSNTGSVRSRSVTGESTLSSGYHRYNSSQRNISSNMPRHLMTDMGNSQFSPAYDTESPYASSKNSPSGSAYPFPRISYHEPEQSNGNIRNTAPPMSRGNSRDGHNSRPTYGLTHSRGSNASLTQRPAMSARTRSASSPNINGHLQRQDITIPEMPPPPVPSGARLSQSGVNLSSKTSSLVGYKVKVNYLDDVFIILLPDGATYTDLADRVEKKIRLCGPAASDVLNFRIRYKDEDGDMITINSDEDVQMAVDTMPADSAALLNLYATLSKK